MHSPSPQGIRISNFRSLSDPVQIQPPDPQLSLYWLTFPYATLMEPCLISLPFPLFILRSLLQFFPRPKYLFFFFPTPTKLNLTFASSLLRPPLVSDSSYFLIFRPLPSQGSLPDRSPSKLGTRPNLLPPLPIACHLEFHRLPLTCFVLSTFLFRPPLPRL